MYSLLKLIHVTCATISIGGFFARGLLMLRDSPLLKRRWLRIVPDINDTVLLAAAVALCVTIRQYPFVDAWLSAKVIGVACYILLGMLALREGRSKPVRAASWAGALAAVGYVVSVAVTHDPRGFLLFVGGA